MVSPDEVEQLGLREAPRVVAHRVDGEGNPAAREFLRVNLAARFPDEREPEHPSPQRG